MRASAAYSANKYYNLCGPFFRQLRDVGYNTPGRACSEAIMLGRSGGRGNEITRATAEYLSAEFIDQLLRVRAACAGRKIWRLE